MSKGRARYGFANPVEERPDWSAVEFVLSELRERKASGVRIRNDEVASLADWAWVSPVTFRRWLREGQPEREGRSNRFEIGGELKLEIALHGGLVETTVRDLVKRGWDLPEVNTVRRAFRRLGPAEQAALRMGEEAARAFELVLLRRVTRRNASWRIDAFYSRRFVLTANGRGQDVAWVLVVIDDASGAIAGILVVRGEPDAGDAAHALAEAIRETDEFPVHGRPFSLYHDNAGCFTSKEFWKPFSHPFLKVAMFANAPYTPRQNGMVERSIGTLRTLLASPLENGTFEDLAGTPLIPEDRAAVPLAALIAEVKAAAIEHNNLPYREDRSITKLQAWRERLKGEVRNTAPQMLYGFMRQAPVLMRPQGLKLDHEFYTTFRLRKKVGTTLLVRYWDMDDRHIEVFLAGKHLARAYRQGEDFPEHHHELLLLTRATDRDNRKKVTDAAVRRAEDFAEEARRAAPRIEESPPEVSWDRDADPHGDDADG